MNRNAIVLLSLAPLMHGAFYASPERLVPTSLTANVIANNAGDGVLITNNSDNNIIQNNAIGTNLSGQLPMGNGGAGVRIVFNSDDNFVGSDDVTLGNLIAYNNKGVVVGDSATDLSDENSIVNNSIYRNTLPGIDLANDGPTPNHAVNPFTGPNQFQNYPVITSLRLVSTGLEVTWTFHSSPTDDFYLQFFANEPGDPEGKRIITSINITTDADGNASGTFITGTIPLNASITANATEVVGEEFSNTSEFSIPAIYGVSNPCLITCYNK